MSLKQILDGLKILEKYYDLSNPLEGGADHDILYGPSVEISEEDWEKDEMIDRKISEADHKELITLGWYVDCCPDPSWVHGI